ncbi:MAG: hypothetical protein DBY32_02025 [Phascolarctobacterium sp.]|nr:MAG: hypothetical protein DBY32_02025 [Phascolarctobacterium sp.]
MKINKTKDTLKSPPNEHNGAVQRYSNLELLRIVAMLVIVMHHYVVNSGLKQVIYDNPDNFNSLLLLILGWGGKTAINCYIFITGYFMCKKNITAKKFAKLVFEVLFYNIIIYALFIISGYEAFNLKVCIKNILPITSIAHDFTSAFLVFYLFIPFLNIFIKAMTKKQHLLLVSLLLCVYSIWASLNFDVIFNYVTWFCILYFVASYYRFYKNFYFLNKKYYKYFLFTTLVLSWLSIVVLVYVAPLIGKNYGIAYFLVSDSNKILAVITAIAAFMYFKNLDIGYNKWINKIAASTFGVLLIHANSDTMRQWLWKDTLNNVGWYGHSLEFIHLFASVISIYVICTLIDMARIKFVERKIFKNY